MAKRYTPSYVLLSYFILIVSLIIASDWMVRGVLSLLLVIQIFANKKSSAFNSVGGIVLFSITIFLLNAFLFSAENPIVSFWIFNLTREGIAKGLEISFLILAITVLSSFVFQSLTDREIAQGISEILYPLRKIKVPVHDIAMIMTLSFRFIPMLKREGEELMLSNRIRSLDSSKGVRRFIPMLLPVFLCSFRRADTLSMAMEARGYNGKFAIERQSGGKIDKANIAICLLIITITIVWRLLNV